MTTPKTFAVMSVNSVLTINTKAQMTRDLLLRKHGIESRASLHTTIDRNLLAEVNEVIPQRKRSQFLESLIRRELKELKAS